MITLHQQTKFLEALKQNLSITKACEAAGISKATYYRWRDSNHKFVRLVEAARAVAIDNLNDLAASKIQERIESGDWKAISFWYSKNFPTLPVGMEERLATAQERVRSTNPEFFRDGYDDPFETRDDVTPEAMKNRQKQRYEDARIELEDLQDVIGKDTTEFEVPDKNDDPSDSEEPAT